MTTNPSQLKNIIEAALMVAGRPLNISDLQKLFDENDQPATADLREIIKEIVTDYQDRGIILQEVASGFQFQAKTELSEWLSKLWAERSPRYSRAFLETLSLIAYRQPITRAEIEEIRGVAVSSNILKTLQEREWVRVIGYKDVPGKPALYATTKIFLDHFNLKSLNELPTLAEIKDLEMQEAKLNVQLELVNPEDASAELESEEIENVVDADEIENEETTAEADEIENEETTAEVDEVENEEVTTEAEDTTIEAETLEEPQDEVTSKEPVTTE